MNLTEVAKLLAKRSKETFPQCESWTASDWFLELVGEVGEAGNIIKKLNRGDQNRIELKEKLAEELSDILVCLLLNSSFHSIDLEESVPIKVNSDSRKRGSDVRLPPKFPGLPTHPQDSEKKIEIDMNSFRLYGLNIPQLRALIIYFQDRNTLDLKEIVELTPEEIISKD